MPIPSDIELIALTKKYGATAAVDAINLKIQGGKYCCLLGPFRLRQDVHAAHDRRSRSGERWRRC